MFRRHRRKPLDPYLESVKEKFAEASEYLKDRRFSPGTVITLLYDAVMIALQRMIIDKKGLKVLEQLRKDKKIYFETLIARAAHVSSSLAA